MLEARRIADVLGGSRVLKCRITSVADLGRAVQNGLPKTSLANAVRHVFADRGEQRRMIYRVVPEATYKRRREHLSPAESERTERLARVIASTEYVWDDTGDARRFLKTAHPALGNRCPLDAALTELGARQVEELLSKILYGIAA
ncbi:MAG: DUF2384 domain-containing protein [Acidobacteria bacterium]|nr:DUF2384 domain-containing protein [Acidobacteriota bacterium]